MPRGAPDFSNVRIDQPLHRLDDLGELAARLGSPNLYDRAGNTIWMTDFEHGLQGVVLGADHANSTGSITSGRSYHGSFSLKLDPRDADNSYVIYGRVLHFLLAGKIGGEFSISLDTDPSSVYLQLIYKDGEIGLLGGLLYGPALGDWKIVTPGPTWVTVLEDFKLQQGSSAWHSVKLVIDTENKEYVRAMMDREVVDLSDYSLYETEDTSLGQMEIRITNTGYPACHAPVYVDGIIITQNEP